MNIVLLVSFFILALITFGAAPIAATTSAAERKKMGVKL